MQKQQIAKVILHQNYEDDGLIQSLKQAMETINEDQQTKIQYRLADRLIECGHQVQQWNAIKLNIWYAKADGIVRAIGNINFPDLKILSVSSNNISSIEMLCRLKAQNLQKLYIRYNKIITVFSLRKMQSNKIQTISMHKNFINDTQYLAQVNWPDLKYIGIEVLSGNQEQNIRFCAKLEHKSAQSRYELWIDSKERILQQPMLQSIVRKYSQKNDAKIYTKNGKF